MRYLKLKEQVEHAVAILETERNWTKLTFAKISGTVIGDKKKKLVNG